MIQLPSGIVLQVCRVIQLLVLWDRIRGQLSLLQWKIQDFDYRDSLTLPLGIHPFWDHNNLAINSNPMHTPPCHPCENLGSVCSSAQIFLPAVKPVSLVREEVEEEVVDVSTLPLPIHYSIMACVNFWPCRAWHSDGTGICIIAVRGFIGTPSQYQLLPMDVATIIHLAHFPLWFSEGSLITLTTDCVTILAGSNLTLYILLH